MNQRARSLGLVCSSLAGAVLLVGASASAQTVPLNDNFANATVIGAAPFTATEDTSLATTEDGTVEPGACFGDGSRSVWFAYTATANGQLQADTLGSNYDTVLGVYTGAPGGLSAVGCNDDSQCGLQSTVVFSAVAGQTYYFRVTAYASFVSGETLTFHLGAPPPPPPPLAASVTINALGEVSAATGYVRVSGTVTCSQAGYYSLYLNAQQATGRGTTVGGAFVGGPCGPTPTTWTTAFQAQSGRFVGGALAITGNGVATAFGTCGASNSTTLNVSNNITLRGTVLKNVVPGATMCFQPPNPTGH